jgi:hypothetical protein
MLTAALASPVGGSLQLEVLVQSLEFNATLHSNSVALLEHVELTERLESTGFLNLQMSICAFDNQENQQYDGAHSTTVVID